MGKSFIFGVVSVVICQMLRHRLLLGDVRFDPPISQLVLIMWSKSLVPKNTQRLPRLARAVRIVSEEVQNKLKNLFEVA